MLQLRLLNGHVKGIIILFNCRFKEFPIFFVKAYSKGVLFLSEGPFLRAPMLPLKESDRGK